MDHDQDEHGAILVPYENGPLLVRGDFTLQTPDGQVIEPGRGTVALCRCGKSAAKPFCDGTHKVIGFKAGTGRDSASPRDRPADQAPASRSDDSPAAHLPSTDVAH